MEGFNAVVSRSDGFDRNISSLEHGKKDDMAYRAKSEWDKLPAADRKRIQSLRDKKKGNKKRKVDKKEKEKETPTRKLAEIAAEVIKDLQTANDSNDRKGDDGKSSGAVITPNSSPASQFGRKAHAVLKFAEGIVKELGDSKDA